MMSKGKGTKLFHGCCMYAGNFYCKDELVMDGKKREIHLVDKTASAPDTAASEY